MPHRVVAARVVAHPGDVAVAQRPRRVAHERRARGVGPGRVMEAGVPEDAPFHMPVHSPPAELARVVAEDLPVLGRRVEAASQCRSVAQPPRGERRLGANFTGTGDAASLVREVGESIFTRDCRLSR